MGCVGWEQIKELNKLEKKIYFKSATKDKLVNIHCLRQ